MRRVWARKRSIALLILTLGCAAPGCTRQAPEAAHSPEGSESLREPGRFEAPHDVKMRRIDSPIAFLKSAVRTTAGDEKEGAGLKEPARLAPEARQETLALPIETAKSEGDLQAVEERARKLIEQAYGLADRGAIYSARSDLLTALRFLCEAMDAEAGDRTCARALHEALTAIDEASDFVVSGERGVDMPSIVGGHQTPVLKKTDLKEVSTILAMQKYFTFAQKKLVIAGNRSTAASDALCGLGKVARSLPASNAAMRRSALVKSLVFQQSAVTVCQTNYHAANELGVLYAQLGRPRDAKAILLGVAEATGWPAAWTNLSRVHTQLQEQDLAELAMNEAKLAERSPRKKAGQSDTEGRTPFKFEWVSPEEFIAEGPDEVPALAVRPKSAGRR